jgi:hypothetical protein
MQTVSKYGPIIVARALILRTQGTASITRTLALPSSASRSYCALPSRAEARSKAQFWIDMYKERVRT